MKQLFRFICVVALAMSASCAKDGAVNPSNETVSLAFAATTLDIEVADATKVAIENVEGLQMNWEAGDEISVHNSVGGEYLGTLTAESMGEGLVFKGSIILGEETSFVAAYPAHEKNMNTRSLQLVSSDIKSDEMQQVKDAMMLTSEAFSSNASELSFMHDGAYHAYTLSGVDATASKIMLRDENQMNLAVLNVDSPSATETFYFATAAQEAALSVVVELSTGEQRQVSSASKMYEAGKLYSANITKEWTSVEVDPTLIAVGAAGELTSILADKYPSATVENPIAKLKVTGALNADDYKALALYPISVLDLGATTFVGESLPTAVWKNQNSANPAAGELTEITLPAAMYNMPSDMFFGCTKLAKIEWLVADNSVATIGNSAFRETAITNDVLTHILSKIKDDGTFAFLGNTFQAVKTITEVKFDKPVASLANNVFYQCNNLNSIEFNYAGTLPKVTKYPFPAEYCYYVQYPSASKPDTDPTKYYTENPAKSVTIGSDIEDAPSVENGWLYALGSTSDNGIEVVAGREARFYTTQAVSSTITIDMDATENAGKTLDEILTAAGLERGASIKILKIKGTLTLNAPNKTDDEATASATPTRAITYRGVEILDLSESTAKTIPGIMYGANATSGPAYVVDGAIKTQLKTVKLPSVFTTFGYSAFTGCTNLSSIDLGNVQNFGAGAGSFATTALTNDEVAEMLEKMNGTVLHQNLFQNLSMATAINVPSKYTSLKPGAFANSNGNIVELRLNSYLAPDGVNASTFPEVFLNEGGSLKIEVTNKEDYDKYVETTEYAPFNFELSAL